MISVSHELELATHMSAQEIRRELAVHLYSQGKLSAGKARELVEMDVAAFQCLLALLPQLGLDFHKNKTFCAFNPLIFRTGIF
jgi:hypothetical protein